MLYKRSHHTVEAETIPETLRMRPYHPADDTN